MNATKRLEIEKCGIEDFVSTKERMKKRKEHLSMTVELQMVAMQLISNF